MLEFIAAYLLLELEWYDMVHGIWYGGQRAAIVQQVVYLKKISFINKKQADILVLQILGFYYIYMLPNIGVQE